MLWTFFKYHGCGNDFILIDNRGKRFLKPGPSLVSRLCHRQFGIGADGLILLENSTQADFGMRIFNADGTEAEMCGNGIRCLKRLIETLGFTKTPCTISTLRSILQLTCRGDQIAVDMGTVSDVRWNIPLSLNGRSYTGHYLNTGVPHLVIFVEDLELVPVLVDGAALRHHSLFQPQGVNVNFAACSKNHSHCEWSYRTYERGVEGETLACGTGATAVALALMAIEGVRAPISLKTRSGDSLEIDVPDGLGIQLCGPATFVFQGTVEIDDHFLYYSEMQSANIQDQCGKMEHAYVD